MKALLRSPTARNALILLGATIATTLAGCTTIHLPGPHYEKSTDQVGTVLVSATMVAPWADVSSVLSPAFVMSGTTAATMVLPTTEQISQQELNTFGASAGIGFPQSSSTSATSSQASTSNGTTTAGTTATAATGSAAPSTTTTTTTTTNGANTGGTTSSQSSTSGPGQNVPAQALNLPTSLPAAPPAAVLGVDPVLRYKEATYLNQEVQLLNNEVAETARRGCYVPYVVKLKLAFMPYVNPLPYSAHVQLAFLPGRRDSLPAYPITTETVRGARAGCDDPGAVPVVVPFLAADDLQLASYSNTEQEARQIALTAAFMSHGINFNGGASKLYEALTAIQDDEMHSALTVARSTNNGLYVLIAPNNEEAGNAALIGQTYDVAVLLLVPRNYFRPADRPKAAQIAIMTYTQFRSAKDGHILEERARREMAASARKILRQFLDRHGREVLDGSDDDTVVKFVGHVVGPIQSSEYSGLFNVLDTCKTNAPTEGYPEDICIDKGYAPALWVAMTPLLLDSAYKSADFLAPVPQKIEIPPQNVVLNDDKSGTVTVVLGDVQGASASTLAASLNLTPSSSPKGTPIVATAKCPKTCPTALEKSAAPKSTKLVQGTPVTLAAQALTIDPIAHTLTLSFPSPAKVGVTGLWDDAHGGSTPPSTLTISQVGCEDIDSLCPEFTPTTLSVSLNEVSAPAAAGAGFTLMDSGNDVLFDSSSTGALPIIINPLQVGVTVNLAIAGAAVQSLTGPSPASTQILPSKSGYALTQAGVYTLNLSDLTTGTIVTVTATGNKPNPAGGSQPAQTGTVTHTFVAIPKIRPGK
jgi:hypothetical protein